MQEVFVMEHAWKISALVAIAACLAASLACGLITRPPVVEWVRPSDGAYAGSAVTVEVRFSCRMEAESAERAFTLECAGSRVEGAFSWSGGGGLMRFTPARELDPGVCAVRIREGARDEDGSELGHAHRSEFFTSDDLVPPEVLDVFPADLARGVPLDSRIRISFSEPMDTLSVERGLRIYPAVEGAYAWNESRDRVELFPFRKLAFLTEYVISPGPGCADTRGNSLVTGREFRFMAGDEYVRPALVEVTSPATGGNWMEAGNFSEHHGLDSNPVLLFAFSERIDRGSFEEGLDIFPSHARSVYWESDRGCVVSFPGGLAAGECYEMRVRKTVKDAAGNQLAEGFTAYFFTDGETAREPSVTAARIVYGNGAAVLAPMGLSEPAGAALADNAALVELQFCAGMRRSSLPENTAMLFINGAEPNFSGTIRRYEWSGSMLTLSLGSLKKGNLYELCLRGGPEGIMSETGTARKGDIRYFFRFGE